MSARIHVGDCRDVLREIAPESAHCVVTSPPYFGLRDYGCDGQIGLEPTPDEFVSAMVDVFREVRRVLRDDGTLWLNLGDSYAGSGRGGYAGGKSTLHGSTEGQDNSRVARGSQLAAGLHARQVRHAGFNDRWDTMEREEQRQARAFRNSDFFVQSIDGPAGAVGNDREIIAFDVATQPFRDAHFATFPPSLIEPCILAGCPRGGVVLDPFGGAGTTGLVADRLQRNSILVELNPAYAAMAAQRIRAEAGLMADVSVSVAASATPSLVSVSTRVEQESKDMITLDENLPLD